MDISLNAPQFLSSHVLVFKCVVFQQEVRKVYKALVLNEDFSGWQFGQG